MLRSPVVRLALLTLAILPFAFAAWYFAAEIIALPAEWLTRELLLRQFPSIAAAVEWQGHALTLKTTLVRPGAGALGYRPITLSLDTLAYTAGRPLFLALMLAGVGRGRRAVVAKRIVIGMLLLTLTETWGMTFRFLAEVAALVPQGFDTWRWNVIALCHQLGTLLMPTLAPVGLWAWFHFEGGRIRLPGGPAAG